MTCLTFPFGEASWQPLAVAVAVDAVGLTVSAAALFVAPAAATVSRHPSASAQRTPIRLRLIRFLPSLSMDRAQRIAIGYDRQRRAGEDSVATRLKPCVKALSVGRRRRSGPPPA